MTTNAPKVPPKNGAKIHQFMNSTPGFLKTKFLSVLGSSNDLINEISNRLEISISHSSSSDADTNEPRDPRLSVCGNEDDESLDENVIDFESRKVKEQRAREELKSGCYRQPSFIRHCRGDESTTGKSNGGPRLDTLAVPAGPAGQSLSPSSSPSSVANVEPRALAHSDSTATSSVPEVVFRSGFTAASFDVTTISSHVSESARRAKTVSKPESASSTTSENDSSDGTDRSDSNRCVRTVSQNSMASSLSMDSRSDEPSPSLAFMKDFVDVLFADSSAITLDMKSDFGSKARTEIGRLSFARLVSSKRGIYKKVNEPTFYSLIQYFAIVLFECCDSEDYSPAKILMNMCFTFYHEVEVPGCEPYREYLYTYLREQPIWQSLRFWNAAIFDALQCERVRSVLVPSLPAIRPARHRAGRNSAAAAATTTTTTRSGSVGAAVATNRRSGQRGSAPDAVAGADSGGEQEEENASSSGQSTDADEPHQHQQQLAATGCGGQSRRNAARDRAGDERRAEEAEMHQNISFGQLGTFTCNMHAFGLPRELCTEFLRKQCIIANLNREQERTLLDNVHRMYNETAKWRN